MIMVLKTVAGRGKLSIGKMWIMCGAAPIDHGLPVKAGRGRNGRWRQEPAPTPGQSVQGAIATGTPLGKQSLGIDGIKLVVGATVVAMHVDLTLFVDHRLDFHLTDLQQCLFAALAGAGAAELDRLGSKQSHLLFVIEAVEDLLGG